MVNGLNDRSMDKELVAGTSRVIYPTQLRLEPVYPSHTSSHWFVCLVCLSSVPKHCMIMGRQRVVQMRSVKSRWAEESRQANEAQSM